MQIWKHTAIEGNWMDIEAKHATKDDKEHDKVRKQIVVEGNVTKDGLAWQDCSQHRAEFASPEADCSRGLLAEGLGREDGRRDSVRNFVRQQQSGSSGLRGLQVLSGIWTVIVSGLLALACSVSGWFGKLHAGCSRTKQQHQGSILVDNWDSEQLHKRKQF